jgi:hypothetical protein
LQNPETHTPCPWHWLIHVCMKMTALDIKKLFMLVFEDASPTTLKGVA